MRTVLRPSVVRHSLKLALGASLVLVALLALTAVPEASAVICGGDLVCYGTPTTIQVTALSSVDCQWADMKALNMLRNQAGCDNGFGFCQEDYARVGACFFDTSQGQWSATWTLTYRCYRCFGPLIQD